MNNYMPVLRRPRTANEIRQSGDPEVAAFVRGRRKAHRLPTRWDDQQVVVKGRKPRYKDHR